MKKLFLSILCFMSISPVMAQDNCQKQCKCTPAQSLIHRLTDLSKKGYMFGHQDDPMYGLSWHWDENRSDIKELVGDYPAIMGFDLGGIEMCDEKNLDSVPFDRIRKEIQNHYKRGGIITISWHPRNPLTGGTSWDVTSDKVVKSVLPGGKNYDLFKLWMQRVGNYMKTLVTDKGEKIPIIFRPWHENNGSWFWWGQKLCTDEEYRALWNQLQDYLNYEGFDNLVWSYSPNLDGNYNDSTYMKRYPGNDRVTIIGEDAYQWGTEADFVKQLTDDLTFLSDFSKKNGKFFALTECGYKNIPDATWWTRVFQPILEKFDILYLLPWRNDPKEYFTPDKNQQSANDFKKFIESPKLMMLKDIKDVKCQ